MSRCKETKGGDPGAALTKQRIQALKRTLSRKRIQAVCASRVRCLRVPKPIVVWFVVALAMFSRDDYRQVFRWLQTRRIPIPGRSTLCEARKRLGVAPLRRLAEGCIRLLAKPEVAGGFYQGRRLMAVDGFFLDVPDTPANERAFGRPRNGKSQGSFPQIRCLALCEVGTHVLYKTLIKPRRRSENAMLGHLLTFLQSDMLLLWDRNFLSYRFVEQTVQRGAELLGRIKSNRNFPVHQALSDGSYLSKIYPSDRDRLRDENGIVVRIIEYTLEEPARTGHAQRHRLLTTLLDEHQHPAETLIVLYHERWEEELAIDEVKTHTRERPVLRSQTPAGVVQEVYGYLLMHFIVRQLAFEAAEQAGLDPDRISYTAAFKILRCRLPEAPASPKALSLWHRDLLEEIAQEVLPPRRNRINPRVIKKKISPWDKKRPKHYACPQPTRPFHESIRLVS